MEAMSTNALFDALADLEAYCENGDAFRPVQNSVIKQYR
jgi:hypothetical protein